MKPAKLIVIYPTPTDVATFEQRYANEHVPMAVEKLQGKSRFVASLINSSHSPYHRMAEVYFPSMQALQACLDSPGGKATAKHAIDISSGGMPLFLTAEVESFDF